MIAKYYHYNHLEPELELFIDKMNEMKYRNYASNLLNRVHHSPEFDMEDSVKRAIAIFRLTGIPVHEHISGVYRSDCNGLKKDWLLSEMACSLIILTSGSTSLEVKDIQKDLLNFLGL